MKPKRKTLQTAGVLLVGAAFTQFLATTAVETWKMVAAMITGGVTSLAAGTYLLVKTDSEHLLDRIAELPLP